MKAQEKVGYLQNTKKKYGIYPLDGIDASLWSPLPRDEASYRNGHMKLQCPQRPLDVHIFKPHNLPRQRLAVHC